MKLLETLKKEIDRQLLMNYLRSMDYDKDTAKEELSSLLYWVKSLPPFLTLYRIIWADDKSEINLDELGSHYSMDKKNLISSHDYVSGYGEKKFLVKVKADRNMVDINQTLANNILYPNEKEITLKDEGKGVKILSVLELVNP